jgi:glycine cleavage system regulatory protein
MHISVVMTVLAADRAGLVSLLSETIAAHEGNWLESRMARLAGQFAGILRVECPMGNTGELLSALAALEGQGISVQARMEDTAPEVPRDVLTLDIMGNDRPGIVRALSSTLASSGANVEELYTTLESAPMAGHPIFHAKGVVSLPAGTDPTSLIEAIEKLGPDLSVSIED